MRSTEKVYYEKKVMRVKQKNNVKVGNENEKTMAA